MAKTFKFGENGKWATKTGSSLAYNDQNDNFKPMPFSVTRDSIATRVNKEGLIEVVGKDKLRIDYTDSTKGVALLEPARTNYLPYSEDFSNAAWTKFAAGTASVPVVTANYAISPDGSQNASRVQFDKGTGTGASNQSIISDTVTVTSGLTTNKSIFVKSNTSEEYDMVLYGSLDATGTNVAKIRITNQWQRFDVFGTIASTLTGLSFGLREISVTGLSNTADVLIWGAQIENGSYATSYIPTSGQSGGVPRAAEVANGAGNSEVFNDSEGVLYSNFAVLKGDTSVVQFSISDKTNNETVKFLQLNSTAIRAEVIMSSGSNFVYDITINPQNFNKFALNYKANEYKVFANGFSYSIPQRATTPSGLNSFQFDRGDGGSDFYGKTKEIGVYDAVLTDAELEALTSYTSFTNMANELNLTIK